MYQPSLYEKNTDIDDEEEARPLADAVDFWSRWGKTSVSLTCFLVRQVDPRVGLTLDRMNDAGDDVNNKELALTRAKRGAQKIQGDERKRCQASAADNRQAASHSVLSIRRGLGTHSWQAPRFSCSVFPLRKLRGPGARAWNLVRSSLYSWIALPASIKIPVSQEASTFTL